MRLHRFIRRSAVLRRGKFATLALALLLVSEPALAQASLVDQAREAARADRNRESADLFAQALSAEPARRREILRELADQLTYSDRAAAAVPLYREVLAWADLPEGDRWRAKRGLALALAWSGQHRESVDAYSELLERDPNDRDARLMRARVQSWRRRYREAEADFRYLVEADPADADARRGLAEAQSMQGHSRAARETLRPLAGADADARTLFLLSRAQHWSGRGDLAGPTLARSIALQSADREAQRLLVDIRAARRPLTEIRTRYSSQSDDTRIRRLTLMQRFRSEGPVDTFGLQYDAEQFDPESGETVTVHRPGVHGRLLLSDAFSISGEAAFAIREAADDADRSLVFNAYATHVPSDFLRFDFGVSRQSFDNVRSMLLDIHSTDWGASVDIGSDAGWKASLRTNYSDISDGNSRVWGQAEVQRRLAWSPNWFAGVRVTALEYDEQLDNGYFNPKRLQSAEALTQLWGRLGRGYFDLRGTLGVEEADPGGSRLIYSGEARLTQPLTNLIEIEGYVNSFSSRHNATGGFSRKTVGVTLRARW